MAFFMAAVLFWVFCRPRRAVSAPVRARYIYFIFVICFFFIFVIRLIR